MTDEPTNLDEARQRMRNEAKLIRGAALWAAEIHYASETPWYNLNYLLGIPSTILAAIASAVAAAHFKNSEYLAAIISIIVATLSALMTFFDPNKNAAAHHASAKGYEALYHDAGFFYRIEALGDLSEKDMEQKLGVLKSRLNTLNTSGLGISTRAYQTAAANLAKGYGELVRDASDIDEGEVPPNRR